MHLAGANESVCLCTSTCELETIYAHLDSTIAVYWSAAVPLSGQGELGQACGALSDTYVCDFGGGKPVVTLRDLGEVMFQVK